MFSILTAVVVILVILVAGYIAYKVKVSPARKRLPRNTEKMTREQASDVINRTSPLRADMEFAKATELGGESVKKVTFPPLDFSTEEQTEIVLLPKNPQWIFAYWNIFEKTVKDFEAQYGDNSWNISQPLLQVYNHTEDSMHEILINDYANNWYLQVNPDSYYTVILGRRFPCGKFVELAVSNKVQTAAADISTIIDKDWLPINECWKVCKDYTAGISSQEFMDK